MKKQLFLSHILLLINIICYAQSADTLKNFIEYTDHHKVYWEKMQVKHNQILYDGVPINIRDSSIIAFQNKHGYFLKIKVEDSIRRRGKYHPITLYYVSKRIMSGKINAYSIPGGKLGHYFFYNKNDSTIKKLHIDSLLVDIKDNPESVKYVQRAIKVDKACHLGRYAIIITIVNIPISFFVSPIYCGISFSLFIADMIFWEIMRGAEHHYLMKAINIYNMAK
jgi:hypothetical protein